MAAARDTVLARTYNLTTLTVLSSTQISTRASAIISNLRSDGEGDASGKPALVALTAKAKVASKLISIVEIAKRELTICYQYNALGSELTEVAPRTPGNKIENTSNPAEEEDSDDDAFENVAAASNNATKRSVPVMTIYLSRVPIKELRNECGEQVHKA